LDKNPVLAEKTVALLNFVEPVEAKQVQKKDYVLYFGRYSQEKGVGTLVKVARKLPQIPFVFAGSGPLDSVLTDTPNIKNVGFQKGEDLASLIREARFTVYPSEWYENCPFSVMESQLYGTPVLGAEIGGIPELIQPGQTGVLFESGNQDALKRAIQTMWNDREQTDAMAKNCADIRFDTIDVYTEKLMKLYFGELVLCPKS
jgi:glycosyltransferase involved in cell wall biosynthesis